MKGGAYMRGVYLFTRVSLAKRPLVPRSDLIKHYHGNHKSATKITCFSLLPIPRRTRQQARGAMRWGIAGRPEQPAALPAGQGG